MKHIIVGTDRVGSRTRQLSLLVKELYLEQGEEIDIIDLLEAPQWFKDGSQYGDPKNENLKIQSDKVLSSEGLIVIVPEYNGSMPGVLKWFLDHLKFPEAFEYRPICFIGLGTRFGGLRLVEHLQQIFGYRNSYIFPERVFIMNVFQNIKDGKLQDPLMLELIQKQIIGFQKFTAALLSAGLHANQIKAPPTAPKK